MQTQIAASCNWINILRIRTSKMQMHNVFSLDETLKPAKLWVSFWEKKNAGLVKADLELMKCFHLFRMGYNKSSLALNNPFTYLLYFFCVNDLIPLTNIKLIVLKNGKSVDLHHAYHVFNPLDLTPTAELYYFVEFESNCDYICRAGDRCWNTGRANDHPSATTHRWQKHNLAWWI